MLGFPLARLSSLIYPWLLRKTRDARRSHTPQPQAVPSTKHRYLGETASAALASLFCERRALISRNGEDLSLWSADDLAQPPSSTPSRGLPHSLSVSTQSSSMASESSTLVASSSSISGSPTPKSVSTGNITPALLLDGARAIEAICRPFPVATVGRPEEVHFDMYTSAFELSVRVGPADRNDKGQVAKAVTEVYLPFIHYAASLPDQFQGVDEQGRGSTSTSSSGQNATSQSAPLVSNVNADSRATTPKPSAIAQAPLELAVDVKVSRGTTAISGQTLLWTYDVPEREETLTLSVKRKGGPIKREGSALTLASEGEKGKWGAWGDVCPSCIIA